jgi:hypothetical protein
VQQEQGWGFALVVALMPARDSSGPGIAAKRPPAAGDNKAAEHTSAVGPVVADKTAAGRLAANTRPEGFGQRSP